MRQGTILLPVLTVAAFCGPAQPATAQGVATAPVRVDAAQSQPIGAAAETFLAKLDDADREAMLFA